MRPVSVAGKRPVRGALAALRGGGASGPRPSAEDPDHRAGDLAARPASSSGRAPRPSAMSGRSIPGDCSAVRRPPGRRLAAARGRRLRRLQLLRSTRGRRRLADPGVQGQASFADLLAGYHQQLGPLTVKAFAGADDGGSPIRARRPRDCDPRARLWRQAGAGDLVDDQRAALDVGRRVVGHAPRDLCRAGSARLAAAPALSAGLEAGAAGNVECDIVRAGGFCATNGRAGEISASGGAGPTTSCWRAARAGARTASTPYASLTWLTRF